jgi:hypothetical protein
MDCQFLADEIQSLVHRYLVSVLRTFSIPLAASTYVLGIADLTGTLRPGEIHLTFSKGLPTKDGLETTLSLRGRQVLVARQPSLRPSDIQKVRAVHCLELEHIQDVIVFSSIGSVPLASKLQGGDYNGDTFWVCWELDLTEDFQNAPALLKIPEPELFGIKVDKRDLNAIFNEAPPTERVEYLFKKGFEFRLQPELLGFITNMHERFCYKYSSINHRAVTILADLYDHLIDSAKSGYMYSQADFQAYRSTEESIRSQENIEPAFKTDIEDWVEAGARARRFDNQERNPEKEKPRATPNMHNALDRLYFRHTKPHVQETLDQLRSILTKDGFHLNPNLCQVFEQERQTGHVNSVVRVALKNLDEDLTKIKQHWEDRSSPSKNTILEDFGNYLRECHAMFKALQPINMDEDKKLRWTSPSASYGPYLTTRWELLKASMFAYKYQNSKRYKFLFYMAGDLLGYLKASQQESRLVVMNIWSVMKPRKHLPAPAANARDDDQPVFKVENTETTDEFEDFHSSFEVPQM